MRRSDADPDAMKTLLLALLVYAAVIGLGLLAISTVATWSIFFERLLNGLQP